ncbi:MAG: DUF1330 domain-containing protein [Pseudomonas sp.]
MATVTLDKSGKPASMFTIEATDKWRKSMSVYLIADIKVTDDGWVPEYASNVHHLVEKHGGKYLSRSGNIETLEGAEKDSTLIAIIEFPTREALDRFAADPDYAPYGQARQAGDRAP